MYLVSIYILVYRVLFKWPSFMRWETKKNKKSEKRLKKWPQSKKGLKAWCKLVKLSGKAKSEKEEYQIDSDDSDDATTEEESEIGEGTGSI